MFKRNLFEKLKKLLSWSPVVLLTGAQKTGKTLLIKKVCPQALYTYITFEDQDVLLLAKNDPEAFIESLTKPVILDKIERVPELFLPIKQDVQKNRQSRMYALVSSVDLLLIPELSDLVVGQMETIELFSFSQAERIEVKENFIENIFKGITPNVECDALQEQEDLYKRIALGGYPELIIAQQKNGYSIVIPWFDEYLMSLLKEYDAILLRKILTCLAAHAGDVLVIADLAKELTISEELLQQQVTLLEALFLVSFEQPWLGNVTNYEEQYLPKIYFNDTGLLSFLLGINLETDCIEESIFAPLLLKNFVISELKKQVSWSQKRVQIYYYNVINGKKVDLIVEDFQGNIIGIVIKNSNSISSEDFEGVHYLQENFQNRFVQGIVLYIGQESVQFSDKLCALPVNALWALS